MGVGQQAFNQPLIYVEDLLLFQAAGHTLFDFPTCQRFRSKGVGLNRFHEQFGCPVTLPPLTVCPWYGY